MQTLRVQTKLIIVAASLLAAITQIGCITYARHAIPADRMPPELRFCERGCRVPVNLALLTQTPPRSYVIGAGDLLSVYVRGILPPNVDDPAPIVQGNVTVQREYYPPAGNVSSPSIGVPLQVGEDGSIPLPVVGDIQVAGLTIQQAADKVVASIIDKQVVQKGREYVYVNLVRSKVHRVVVVREESDVDAPTVQARTSNVITKRGFAQVVDLPSYENDILHALTATGGMPGTDAANEIWILRREQHGDLNGPSIMEHSENGVDPVELVTASRAAASAKRIPLWTRNGEPPSFTQKDVMLEEGDIVYVRSRPQEVFYTGGLIVGAEIPLPRDHDIDVLEAISLANASVGGPAGASGQVFRAGAGPGNVLPPSRAVVLRKIPNGQQVAIRVNLTQAMRDPLQRIVIQPGDFIMLYYKPGETFTNVALNFINFNFLIGAD